jgi:DNA polymerase-4
VEDTFAHDLTTIEEMQAELSKLAEKLIERVNHHQLKGRTITLKIKYSDFKQITRNHSFPTAVCDLQTLMQTAIQLLSATETTKKVRLLGLSFSNFYDPDASVLNVSAEQLRLF